MARKRRAPVASPPEILALQTVRSILRRGQRVGLLLPRDSTPPQTFWHTEIVDHTVQGDVVVTPAPPPELLPSGSQALEASVVFRPAYQASLLRVNFETTILDRISSPHDSTVDALMLLAPRTVQRANLRDAYRVAIPSVLEFGTRLLSAHGSFEELPTTLVDLSASGALLSLQDRSARSWPLEPGDPIALELDCRAVVASLAVRLMQSQLAVLTLPSQVVRTTVGPSREWCHVAMKFQDVPPPQAELLHTLVLKVQQWLASRHQSWGKTGWMATLHARHVRPLP